MGVHVSDGVAWYTEFTGGCFWLVSLKDGFCQHVPYVPIKHMIRKLSQNYPHFLKTAMMIILKWIVWESENKHCHISSASVSWVNDQNIQNIVLTNNWRIVWPTKILMSFSSFSDNLRHYACFIFQNSMWISDRAQSMPKHSFWDLIFWVAHSKVQWSNDAFVTITNQLCALL